MTAPADHLGRHVLDGAAEAEGLLVVQRLLAETEVGQRDVAVGAEQDAAKRTAPPSRQVRSTRDVNNRNEKINGYALGHHQGCSMD